MGFQTGRTSDRYDVIVVGAGPAGSSCARVLQAGGARVLLLDRETFPREKLCAGWITPRVFRLLGTVPDEYPSPLTTFRKLHFYIKGIHIPVRTLQYAIRRKEFDQWLLQRSGVQLTTHRVREIRRVVPGLPGAGVTSGVGVESFGVSARPGFSWLIDDRFEADVLVGAGGSACPVARFFRGTAASASPADLDPRSDGRHPDPARRIVAMEEEFRYPAEDRRCLLWFFEKGLPGYSWYVPKAEGYLTVGVGGTVGGLRRRGMSIRDHWDLFVQKLRRENLVRGHTFSPRGHNYLLREKGIRTAASGISLPGEPSPAAWLIGDAAGLATLDMGEGIAPAIHSGLSVARAILESRGCGNGLEKPELHGIQTIDVLQTLPRGLRSSKSYSIPAIVFGSPRGS